MISKSELIKISGPYGLYALARHLTRGCPRILMYHRFSETISPGKVCKETFERQIVYMKKKFNVVPLSAICEAKQQSKPYKKNSIVLTIDDGYEDFYNIAYPILKKHNVPATIFVTTQFVEGDFWLWPDKITWLLDQSPAITSPIKLGSKSVPKGIINDSNKSEIWGLLTGYLLTLSDNEKLYWIDSFAQKLNCELPVKPPSSYRAVNWSQLKEMQENGIEIGGHTVTHPSLGRVERNQLQIEIEACKNKLDQELGSLKRDFCYPNGQPQDYTEEAKKVTQSSGFRSSVVAFYDKNSLNDPFELRRHTVGEEDFQFYKSVNGVETLASRLLSDHNRLEWKY